jgi:protein tyrosine/serine phosphatase
MSVPGIKNFGKVDEYLYRGAQPTDEGVEQLHKMDMDTIVDLRSELHGAIANEHRQVVSLGMRFINLPGGGWAVPKDEEIARFFGLVREQPRRKIFIHCWLGGDRSGMFIAAYRIAFDGWTPEQAIEEMREFHYLEFWHPNMKEYVLHFPERLAESPQLEAFRKTTGR